MNHVYLINMLNIHDERDRLRLWSIKNYPSLTRFSYGSGETVTSRTRESQRYGIIRTGLSRIERFKIILVPLCIKIIFSLIVSERRSTEHYFAIYFDIIDGVRLIIQTI